MLRSFQLVEYFIPVLFICRQSRICFFFITQKQVTPKSIVRSCRNSNSSEILCLSRLHVSATFIKIPIKTQQARLRTKSQSGRGGYLSTKGQVHSKSIFRSGWNLHSFEIFCLSRLTASLIKIQLKLNMLCSRQSQKSFLFFVCFCFTFKGK